MPQTKSVKAACNELGATDVLASRAVTQAKDAVGIQCRTKVRPEHG